jgi:hypothetical protein
MTWDVFEALKGDAAVYADNGDAFIEFDGGDVG